MKFSIVIPCYNEYSNIPTLINYILELKKDYDSEYILVENGSTDRSKEYLQNNIEGKYKNIKIAYVSKNEGYGFGVKQGLKLCTGDYLGWMHADMQVLPNDLRIFFDFLLIRKSDQKVFLKAKRLNRSLLDRFFTTCQSVISSIIFFLGMKDIGATPVIFSKSLIDSFDTMPNDFAIELFTYLTAKKKKFQIKRFDIVINKRKYSVSSWNTGLLSKIKLSFRLIKSSLLIKFRNKNN
jgi:glycosyltransferase involved in cell wall biosynthesis